MMEAWLIIPGPEIALTWSSQGFGEGPPTVVRCRVHTIVYALILSLKIKRYVSPTFSRFGLHCRLPAFLVPGKWVVRSRTRHFLSFFTFSPAI